MKIRGHLPSPLGRSLEEAYEEHTKPSPGCGHRARQISPIAYARLRDTYREHEMHQSVFKTKHTLNRNNRLHMGTVRSSLKNRITHGLLSEWRSRFLTNVHTVPRTLSMSSCRGRFSSGLVMRNSNASKSLEK